MSRKAERRGPCPAEASGPVMGPIAFSKLVLVGMMGAGKTTIGRELARRLGLKFVDCDHEIEARTGVKVSTIFEFEGEEGFRRRETQVIDDLTAGDGYVIATGGGAVLSSENRRLLHERSLVIYLDVPPHVLWERTRHDRNRPLLQCEDPRGKIEELYRTRGPLYRQVAHVVIHGGRTSPVAMTRTIEKELLKRCKQ